MRTDTEGRGASQFGISVNQLGEHAPDKVACNYRLAARVLSELKTLCENYETSLEPDPLADFFG